MRGHARRERSASLHPFRERMRIGPALFEVRMESWLPAETVNPGGFGHVIRDGRHVMALERGINLIWFDEEGRPSIPVYGTGLYAHEPRFRIPVNAARLAGHIDAWHWGHRS